MGAELNKALVAAQAEMRNPRLTSVNPHFRNRYADLAEVRECVMPVLAKHGLASEDLVFDALKQKKLKPDQVVPVSDKARRASGSSSLIPLSNRREIVAWLISIRPAISDCVSPRKNRR